ncbi:MAG: hypothetical protein U0X39_09680 [Bacteroidales bacterium]
MKPALYRIFLSIFISLSITACEKTLIPDEDSGFSGIKSPSIQSGANTSVVAIRKDASVELSLSYFDPAWWKIGLTASGYPDYYEVYISDDMGVSWKLQMTADTSYLHKNLVIEGLKNGIPYQLYLKEHYNKPGSSKNTNVVMFVPSSFKPVYTELGKDQYSSVYSFDVNENLNPLVYAKISYEYSPGYSAATVFFSKPGIEPVMVETNSWFPDLDKNGSRISYSSDKGEVFDGTIIPEHITIYDITAGSSSRVTTGYSVNRYPSWSPDNKLIAYSTSSTGDYNLRIKTLDPKTHSSYAVGSEPVFQQPVTGYTEIRPSWSADQKYIYYTLQYYTSDNSNPGNFDIYRKNYISGKTEPVFSTTWTECSPVVSPDNSRIAFLSNYNGKLQAWIYVIDSGKLIQPIETGTYSFSEVWSQLKWKNNNILLFANQESIFSMTVE